ncbi:hypothetical protein [Haloplanus pelagicus]|jgi:hypothetical protein|uniref:hypothetical protein n=1 Tax=Haloplanus pelagicus TaxID=2949995 RepID=UPI00203F2D4C|nr:hypothetical protein [Haloplanus sp. HW8-1]
MTEDRFGSRRRTIGVVVGTAVAYVVVAMLGHGAARASALAVPLTPGLVVALGLVLGPVVAWGAGAGYVAVDLLTGAFGPTTAVGYLGQFVLVVTAHRLWGAFGPLSSGTDPGVRTPRNALEYGLVVATTALITAAITGFGTAMLAESPFAATVGPRVRGTLLSTLVVGAPLLYALAPLADRVDRRVSRLTVDGGTATAWWNVPTGWWVAAVGLAWCVAGYGISFVFRDVGLTSTHLLINRLGRGVLPILAVAGPDGRYLQLVVGGTLAAAYVVLVVGIPFR